MIAWTPGRPLSVLSGADDQELEEAIRGRGPGGIRYDDHLLPRAQMRLKKIFHPTHENSPFERYEYRHAQHGRIGGWSTPRKGARVGYGQDFGSHDAE